MKRMILDVNGIVQGVGFRPFIHKLVKDYGLNGWVKNTSSGVIIEAEGNADTLRSFVQEIRNNSPKLAVIEKVSFEITDELHNYKGFKIIKSAENHEKFTLISPDVCICEDCLRELFDKDNRRYRFPFINCTNCGPRFTIIKDIPYDRDKTTMGMFPMCDSCRDEYSNINDRRYHAQPDCCFTCGPKLFFKDGGGKSVDGDAIDIAREYLRNGRIVAVKGLGGFHLSCDARNSETVKILRERKHRDEKPFALMCRDLQTVEKFCLVCEEEKKLLESFRRPIVLLKKKDESLNYISQDNNYIGVMLPYTPVHYLLMEDGLDALVMTSANISDMPILYKNDEAFEKLNGVADGFLMNDRDINIRCDDSLMMIFEGKEYPVRRSRGYVPFPVKVNQDLDQILACGAEQKASFSVSRGKYVFTSHHIGDMKNIETLKHYEEGIRHFEKMFDIKPDKIVCDMHPDYMSTNYGVERSKKEDIPICYVQHHHAHMASCMADNNLSHDVMGIIWDGTGYGMDDTIWGGEFLYGGYRKFQRLGSIRPILLPGGDKAVKEIYRIAYSLIYDALGYIPERFKYTKNHGVIENMIKSRINSCPASSIGRLFDGISAVLGLKLNASYEGQGAIVLESRASENEEGYYSWEIYTDDCTRYFDWRPMIREIIQDIDNNISVNTAAAKFMNTLAKMAVEISKNIRSTADVNDVVLSGGVFQNMYILKALKRDLVKEGFNVYSHSRVSTNDEGISLGQTLIAANGGGLQCV